MSSRPSRGDSPRPTRSRKVAGSNNDEDDASTTGPRQNCQPKKMEANSKEDADECNAMLHGTLEEEAQHGEQRTKHDKKTIFRKSELDVKKAKGKILDQEQHEHVESCKTRLNVNSVNVNVKLKTQEKEVILRTPMRTSTTTQKWVSRIMQHESFFLHPSRSSLPILYPRRPGCFNYLQ
ncbi:unnamed protein product [Amoebophrya sp. A25]|nr:unnamed protein product [Amoebophrya sp. A25]|eukprot:GSA25T00025274001.1